MWKSILYMILAAIAFTAINAIVRYVDHLPTFQLVFFRSIGTVACCLVVLRIANIPIWGNRKKLLILRGIVGFTSMSLFFYALQIMPLGSAVSLRYLSPFFATAMAIFLLKEKVIKWQWLFFLTAFAGVLVVKGFDARISSLGLSVIILSALFSGMVYVIIRAIGETEHPVVIVNYFLTISASISGIVCLFQWIPPRGIEWILLLGMGLLGFSAQYLMTRALQWSETNLITPFKYSEVVATVIAGWWIFGEPQSIGSLMGMGVIVFSLLGNVWVKTWKRSGQK